MAIVQQMHVYKMLSYYIMCYRHFNEHPGFLFSYINFVSKNKQ